VADGVAPKSVSRSAFLELRDEQQLVRNGYEFLDEKRVHLAAEMLRQRDEYRELRARCAEICERAADALVEAAAAGGLESLQVHPAKPLAGSRVQGDERRFVGLSLIAARFEAGDEQGELLPAATGPVRDCAAAFRAVVETGVRLAAVSTNLERLMYEYRRTERRVRALENVILPEISGELAMMEEHLDVNEQEEVIRVRSIRQRE
jgi:V/A-type H+-transporting ATPase subunit D